MQNFIKTIMNALKSWTKKAIKDSTADWNQNDKTADNYVKNRTHWEETKTVVLVDNLTRDDCYSGNAPKCNFIPDQKYDVTWNGVLYEGLVCYFDGSYNIIASPNYGTPFYIDDDGGNSLYVESVDESTDWILSISTVQTVVHKLDSKYLNLPANSATTDDVQEVADTKMDKSNPIGTGSFSMNRVEDSEIGSYSSAIGYEIIASREHQFVSGRYNVENTKYTLIVNENQSLDIFSNDRMLIGTSINIDLENGLITLVDTKNMIWSYVPSRYKSVYVSTAGKIYFIEDTSSYTASGTIFKYTCVCYSIAENTAYAHIVGNGTADDARSNAHTLDWDGNGWFAGDVYVGSTSGTDKDEGSKKLATEEYVNSIVGDSSGSGITVSTTAQVGQLVMVKSVDENGKPTEWESKSPADIFADFGFELDENGTLVGGTVTGGGSGIDVTATVGQTIVVKEVGANGKPTKWEAADFPKRELVAEVSITSANGTIEATGTDDTPAFYKMTWNDKTAADFRNLLSAIPLDRLLHVTVEIPGLSTISTQAAFSVANGVRNLVYVVTAAYRNGYDDYGSHVGAVSIYDTGMHIDYTMGDAVQALNYGLPLILKIYAI